MRDAARPEQRPTELYRALMISSGGLSDRLARLAKAGLVSRHAAQGEAARARAARYTPAAMAAAMTQIYRDALGLGAPDQARGAA